MATDFVARDGDKLHTRLVCAGILQRIGILQRQCINIHDDPATSAKYLNNFGPVIPGILLLIFMSGWVQTWPKYA